MAIEDVISASKERLESLIAPINGGVGTDISYDEGFDALKNEIDKMQSLSGGKVDWGNIISGADEILADKSKDFRVALYYAAAKSQLDGLTGLLDGLVLLQELTTAFWEPMFPSLKRPKARGNLAGWYADTAAAAFADTKTTSKEADLVGAIDLVSRTLDGELRDKLGEAYAGMGALRNTIRSLVASTPKEAAPPPPPPPKPEPAAAPAPQQAAPPPPRAAAPPPPPPSLDAGFSSGPSVPSAASITSPDAAMGVITQCSLLLTRAGDALRMADPGNPLAYRVGRMGFWMELNQAPPGEDGRTLVPPPPDGMRERFESFAAAENWIGVINAADEVAGEYILWLDPHRYIANAMDRLGAIFINAKKTLLREIAYMLLRAPTLPTLSFSDGTPFADGQTKMWLEAEVAPVLGGAGGAGGGGGAPSFLDEPLKEARGLAASGKLPEAIEVVSKAAASAPSPAERFRGRLAIAKLCLQAEQFAIARAQLEGLEKLVETHRLAEWEPELCAELYSALYAAHKGLNRGEEIPPEARLREALAFERLCQLDAGAALKLATA